MIYPNDDSNVVKSTRLTPILGVIPPRRQQASFDSGTQRSGKNGRKHSKPENPRMCCLETRKSKAVALRIPHNLSKSYGTVVTYRHIKHDDISDESGSVFEGCELDLRFTYILLDSFGEEVLKIPNGKTIKGMVKELKDESPSLQDVKYVLKITEERHSCEFFIRLMLCLFQGNKRWRKTTGEVLCFDEDSSFPDVVNRLCHRPIY